MNTIKTWQERTGNHNIRPGSVKHMIAEIAELRAALAARATPAQPDSVLWAAAEKLASIWDGCEGEGIEDIGATIRHDFKMFAEELGTQRPSPSSVGAAIRALPLPDMPARARLYTSGLGGRKYRRASTMNGPGEPLILKSEAAESMRALLSEAAALAEQQGQKIAQDGRDALLLEAADFLWSAARMEQSSYDSPPEPFSEWDNDALVLSNKLRSGVKDVSLTEDALRYRHLRNLMRFSSSKLEAPTMTLSAPLDAPEHDPHTDWMAERFDESVDRTVDASIAAHNNVRETEASNGNG